MEKGLVVDLRPGHIFVDLCDSAFPLASRNDDVLMVSDLLELSSIKPSVDPNALGVTTASVLAKTDQLVA